MSKIAIIGLSCLFPDAKTPEEFWQNLIAQKQSTATATVKDFGIDPEIFYHPKKGTPDKTYSLKGGYIRDFEFDPTGYNLPPELIASLDDTFKWSLYAAKQAITHSGYWGKQNLLAKCGVILGNLSFPTKLSQQLFSPIYQQAIAPAVKELLQDPNIALAHLPETTKASVYNAMISGLPAAVVAQALSLSRINFCLDAACSSSFYAIKLASHYLSSHKADMMLAGAISCADSLFVRMLFSGVQGFAEDGTSRPLDKTSRGLIPGDGVGMVVLKRYADAIRDGDNILATICGNGLSNDGKGKHLLSPNTKGQVLAFERAYNEAQISPQSIDYLECHATGTLLGDTTELNSIATFFGQHQASPLVGSTKANTGHLLTAAGMVGLTKVILSMSHGVIPPTINVDVPLASDNNVISSDNIVTKATAWPNNNTSMKRAAISAFGFGGTNSHLVIEQSITTPTTEPTTPTPPAKIAIVGMDAFFGGCDGLDAFERSIFETTQHFIPLPPARWHGIDEQTEILQKYGFSDGKPPVGAYIKDFDIDTLAYKIPPNEVEKLNPQQLLLLKVADRAVKDAGLQEGGNVAVIVAAETEFSVHQLPQRWDLSWQVKAGLEAENIALPETELSQLETVVKDSIHQPVETGEYVSHIANIMASRISAVWNFTGPAFTVTSGENSALKALEIAQMLLSSGEVEAVVLGAVDLAGGVENVLLRSQLGKINTGINTLSFDENADGWMIGEGAGAVVLKRHDTAQQEQQHIYAVLDAISFAETTIPQLNTSHAEAIQQACQQAFAMANIAPTEINYLEVFGSGIPQQDAAEISGLLKSYPKTGNGLRCAIGSVKANIGHTYVASGIASLIKTALCLYYRYIPGTPQWSGAKTPEQWSGSPFYVATESRPWFMDKGHSRRIAAINSIGIDGTYAHVILSEGPDQQKRDTRYLQQMPYQLFPLAANSQGDLQQVLEQLEKTIAHSACLLTTASETFNTFQQNSEAKYALAITGRNKKELLKQIDAARKGVNTAFEKGKDWQSPLGSYFTANPLGKSGEIAYIYPAAVNSYLGIGRTIFRVFPSALDDLKNNNLYDRAAEVEKFVYPRSLSKLSTRQLETLEKQLLDNSLVMFESEMACARYMTAIFRDNFQVQPKYVFGYSMGETSMMIGQGVWSEFESGSNTFNSSPLFGDKLSGPKNAVREYWGLNTTELKDDNFWTTYVLMATPDQVEAVLKHETKVYLTQINTPEEVLIAGEKTACQRVIKTLGCNAFPAPFDHVIHCDPMRSQYEEIARVNTLPSQNLPGVTFYSAANYAPIPLESETIARSIATGLCQPLDFPRLVNRIYEDGAKIFIEAGAGGVCSRWISKILENREHIAISLNRRGTDEHNTIVKALAKLLSHRVNLDLSSLYNPSTSKQNKLTLKTITLGGKSITQSILTPENREKFQNIAQNLNKYRIAKQPAKNINEHHFPIPEELQSSESVGSWEQKPLQPIVSSPATKHQLDNTIRIMELNQTQYKQLSENNNRITKNHTAFLQARKDFSKQMSEIIQLQLACAANLLNEK
jgi:PfaB family protein